MTAVPQAIVNGPMPYRRRRPERTLLYRTVQAHFETWLALTRDGPVDGDPVPANVEREFRRYLECGILAHGFARAGCGECGHDFLIAFSCKGRGVCPPCNTRHMIETAAHLPDAHLHHNCVVLDHAWCLRLLHFCARPPFALERRQQRDAEHLIYAASQPDPGGSGPLRPTPLSPPWCPRRRFIAITTSACCAELAAKPCGHRPGRADGVAHPDRAIVERPLSPFPTAASG